VGKDVQWLRQRYGSSFAEANKIISKIVHLLEWFFVVTVAPPVYSIGPKI